MVLAICLFLSVTHSSNILVPSHFIHFLNLVMNVWIVFFIWIPRSCNPILSDCFSVHLELLGFIYFHFTEEFHNLTLYPLPLLMYPCSSSLTAFTPSPSWFFCYVSFWMPIIATLNIEHLELLISNMNIWWGKVWHLAERTLTSSIY